MTRSQYMNLFLFVPRKVLVFISVTIVYSVKFFFSLLSIVRRPTKSEIYIHPRWVSIVTVFIVNLSWSAVYIRRKRKRGKKAYCPSSIHGRRTVLVKEGGWSAHNGEKKEDRYSSSSYSYGSNRVESMQKNIGSTAAEEGGAHPVARRHPRGARGARLGNRSVLDRIITVNATDVVCGGGGGR